MIRRRSIARVVAPFVAAIVTVGVMTLVAGARDTDISDPNDARGKLDVSRVRLAHEQAPFIWTVVTFQEWGIREMWDRGYVVVLLDTRMGPAPDLYLLVGSSGSTLQGTLWRIRTVGPDAYAGTVPVNRRSSRSVTIRVAQSRLLFGDGRRFYRWWVETIVTSDACPRTCQDRAPNRAATVLNWRPGMSPTPSPSPTSSPSRSP